MCPQKESNLHQWLRKLLLYPLSYGDEYFKFTMKIAKNQLTLTVLVGRIKALGGVLRMVRKQFAKL